MAKIDVLDILRSKKSDPMSFHFDNLWIPPMQFYLSPQDVEELRKIATSVRLSSKIQQKYKMIDDIMIARGFKRFSAGTNRVVYRCLEDTRFLVKIAVDKVGMQDNPLEYKNQFLLQPFITKMFYVSPCGTVGFSERVLPIKNKEEFRQIAPDVFDIIVNKILGMYVVEDVGTKYFMNWGIRPGFGPVLLDYPYVYNLDGDKLFCNWTNPMSGELCNGEIDYDAGFNHLVCTRCGKSYLATDLRDDSIDNKIVIKKGGFQMRVLIKKGDRIISEPIPTDNVMVKPNRKPKKKTELVVSINHNNGNTVIINGKVPSCPNNVVPKHHMMSVTFNTDSITTIKGDQNRSAISTNQDVPSTPTVTHWSPDIDDDEDDIIDFKKDTVDSESFTKSSEDEDIVETTNSENELASDNTENDTVDYDDDSDDDSRFERASDIDLDRRHSRPSKNQYLDDRRGNMNYKMGKNSGKKKGGTKSTFIPSYPK